MAAPRATAKALTNKTCKDITDLVLNYLNDTLGAGVKRDFKQHLRICPDCVAFLNTYKKTVAMTRSVRAEDMPENVRRSILEFLRGRVRK